MSDQQDQQIKELREFVQKALDFIDEHGDDWDELSSGHRCVCCKSHFGHACEPDCDRMLLVKQAGELLGGGE